MNSEFDPFVAEWVSFSKSPKHDLIEKCLKMAQILEYPELNISQYVEKIGQMSNSLKIKIGEIKNSTYIISMLNEMPEKRKITTTAGIMIFKNFNDMILLI